MKQDLMDWLNGRNSSSDERTAWADGTGLLLAPIGAYPEDGERTEASSAPAPQPEPVPPQEEAAPEPQPEPLPVEQAEPVETNPDLEPPSDELSQVLFDGPAAQPPVDAVEEPPLPSLPPEPEESAPPPEPFIETPPPEPREAKPRLALGTNDKPMPILWTHVVSMPDEWPEGFPQPEGQRRGGFFTQKLHDNLQGRKNLATERRQSDKKRAPRYGLRAALFALLLLLPLAASCAALVWLRNNSSEFLNGRGAELFREGRYEEAMSVYQTGYRRYPNALTFLIGLADSAERAGHLQTARVAWESYISALPQNDTEHRDLALARLTDIRARMKMEAAEAEVKDAPPAPNPQPAPAQAPAPTPDPEPQPSPAPSPEPSPTPTEESGEPEPVLPPAQIPAPDYGRLIEGGLEALRRGRWDDAILSFAGAVEFEGGAQARADTRPWVGLAGAYQGKGMDFDAIRVLETARGLFPRDPTIETMLREARARNRR